MHLPTLFMSRHIYLQSYLTTHISLKLCHMNYEKLCHINYEKLCHMNYETHVSSDELILRHTRQFTHLLPCVVRIVRHVYLQTCISSYMYTCAARIIRHTYIFKRIFFQTYASSDISDNSLLSDIVSHIYVDTTDKYMSTHHTYR